MKTLYIILSFCFGLFIGYLIFKSQRQETIVSDNTSQIKSEHLLKQIDSLKQAKEDLFTLLKDSLSKKFSKQNQIIAEQKKSLLESQAHLNNLVFLLKADTLSKNDSSLVDSLGIAINNNELQTDTLLNNYDKSIKLCQNMVAVRDSEIVLLNKSYTSISDFAREQILREQKLTNDLNTALKAIKRKRIQNKIWAGGMLFISGIATTLFIKSRQ